MFAGEHFEIAKVLPFEYSKLLWQNQKKKIVKSNCQNKKIFFYNLKVFWTMFRLYN